jgi:hypothetical protein
MLGIKWRKALYQAEALRELNDGQFGSRPRRNAVDPVFIEEMQFEISRASRKILVQTNYDAMSCYDRIIPNLAMLVSRKYGVPKLTTQSNSKTLEQAEYRTPNRSWSFLHQAIPILQNTPFMARVKAVATRL